MKTLGNNWALVLVFAIIFAFCAWRTWVSHQACSCDPCHCHKEAPPCCKP